MSHYVTSKKSIAAFKIFSTHIRTSTTMRIRVLVALLLLLAILLFIRLGARFVGTWPFLDQPYDALPPLVRVFGDASLPAVVLMTGFESYNSLYTDLVIELLQTTRHRVIVYSAPSAQHSKQQPVIHHHDSFDILAGEALKGIQTVLRPQERFTLVGVSFGSLLAQHIAFQSDRVRSLVLVSTMARVVPTVWETELKIDALVLSLDILSRLAPITTQRYFASFLVPYVFAASDPRWQHDVFVREFADLHLPTLLLRMGLVRTADTRPRLVMLPASLPVTIVNGVDAGAVAAAESVEVCQIYTLMIAFT
jgi:pimeloyl-ACP methyl ester carboxylesterase